MPGDLGSHHDPKGLGEGAQARHEGGEPQAVLVEERHHVERGQEARHRQEDHDRRDPEEAVAQEPQVEQRLADIQLDDHQDSDEQGPGDSRPCDERGGPAVGGTLADGVHEEREACPGQHEAREVEAARLGLPVLPQEQETKDKGEDPDGEVRVEDPAPRQLGDEDAAQHRTERRGQGGGDDQDAGCPDPLLGGKGAVQHRHADRGEHSAAHTLEDAVDDELGQVVGLPAQHGGRGEDGDGRQQDALRAEAVAQPPRCRNEDRQAHEEARHHHVHARGGTWKSRPRVGRATLTIVMSMIAMNMDSTKTIPTVSF